MNIEVQTLLVIDEDKRIYCRLKQGLKKDLKIRYSKNLKSVSSILEKDDIDVCIIGLDLPETELLNWLKSLNQDYPQIPVIVLRNNLPKELLNIIISIEYGAAFAFEKPIEVESLIQAVHTCLEKGGRKWAYAILSHFKHKEVESLSQVRKEEREKRLMEIYKLIEKEPQKWTSCMLAQKFDVNPRQIQYDIQKLKSRGNPICTAERRYFLDKEKNNAKY